MIIKNVLLLASNKLECTIHLDQITAKFEAQLLLQHALGVNRAWLIAHDSDALPANTLAQFETLLNRRLNGEPIAYILGYREFFGLQLKVSADTLIPRPDTETLVEAALAKIPLMARQVHHERDLPVQRERHLLADYELNFQAQGEQGLQTQQKRELMTLQEQNLLAPVRPELVERCWNDAINGESYALPQQFRVLDLGTGSGAIALAIAKHRPLAQVTALDASQAALGIAIENAQNLEIPNVNFMLSDWFSALSQANVTQKFDVIVSNPPYIEADDAHLKQGDLRFEPLSALASGADGLQDIRIIISQAPQHLNPQGWLLLEHGYNQAASVAALLKQAGFIEVETIEDLGGNHRVTLGKIANSSF